MVPPRRATTSISTGRAAVVPAVAARGSGSGGGRDDVVDGRNIGDASDGRGGADRVTLDSNGDASIQGSVGFGSDRDDFYTFTADGSGQARITLSGLSDSAYTRLYDASGSEIDHDDCGQ